MTQLELARWAIDFSREWPRDQKIDDEQLAWALEMAAVGIDPVTAADIWWGRQLATGRVIEDLTDPT